MPATSSSALNITSPATPPRRLLGLEEIDDGLWNILRYKTLLGGLDLRTGTITGATFRSEEC
jgi:hypothetical protein